VIEISSHAELVSRCQGDTLCLWAARGLDGRSRAWRSADGMALAVAGAGLSTRDRIAVLGAAGALVPLVRDVLQVVGPTFRPLGDPPLTDALVAGIPQLKRAATFGWMDYRPAADTPSAGPGSQAVLAGPQAVLAGPPAVLAGPEAAHTVTDLAAAAAADARRSEPHLTGPCSTGPCSSGPFSSGPFSSGPHSGGAHSGGVAEQAGPSAPGVAHWLMNSEIDEVTELLDAGYAQSDARPGVAGVERWAGVRNSSGRLVAVTALAWSAVDVGYLAGVAVHPAARGRGLGATVCGFVLAEALRGHGAAALMVDQWNDAAIQLYLKLGMRYRPVAVAAVKV
jgi:GNAT superfamily N-acetyltransferase